MSEPVGIDSIVPFIAVAVVVAFFVGMVVFSRSWSAKLAAVKAAVIREYGLTDHDPSGTQPNWSGTVDGLRVTVDVLFVQYATYDTNLKRPYTRVKVELETDPLVVVRVRSTRYTKAIVWPERPSGDPAFDQRFVTYAAEGVALESVLTEPVRQAFLQASPPDTLEAGAVIWIQPKHVTVPKLMLDAIAGCIRVASRLQQRRASGG